MFNRGGTHNKDLRHFKPFAAAIPPLESPDAADKEADTGDARRAAPDDTMFTEAKRYSRASPNESARLEQE